MTKRHRVGPGFEHTGLDALVDTVRDRREGCVEQPPLGPVGHERDALQQTSRRGREPRDARQHRVAHRRRQRLGTRREQLGDEKRVPRVSAWIASPSAACEDASSRTASTESGGTVTRSTAATDVSSPSRRRSG